MDSSNRLNNDTSITKRLIQQLRVCNLEAIYLIHICMVLGTFRWLDFLVDGRHILYMTPRGVYSFLIFASLLLCIIRLLCSLIFSLTLLRYRVPLHERYQDVCFCIVFVLIMYSFHATGVLPTTMRQWQLSVHFQDCSMAKGPHESFLEVDEDLAFYYKLFYPLSFSCLHKRILALLYSTKISFFVILSSL